MYNPFLEKIRNPHRNKGAIACPFPPLKALAGKPAHSGSLAAYYLSIVSGISHIMRRYKSSLAPVKGIAIIATRIRKREHRSELYQRTCKECALAGVEFSFLPEI